MRSRTLLASLLCVAATAAFPAVGFAQAAGDTEYSGVAGVNAQSPAAPATPAATPASGTAGETDQGASPAASTPATATPATAQVAGESTSGTLPFTGRDLLLMALAGIALVGLGAMLRTAAGRATPAS